MTGNEGSDSLQVAEEVAQKPEAIEDQDKRRKSAKRDPAKERTHQMEMKVCSSELPQVLLIQANASHAPKLEIFIANSTLLDHTAPLNKLQFNCFAEIRQGERACQNHRKFKKLFEKDHRLMSTESTESTYCARFACCGRFLSGGGGSGAEERVWRGTSLTP